MFASGDGDDVRVEVMMREQTKNVSMCHGKVAQWGTKHQES